MSERRSRKGLLAIAAATVTWLAVAIPGLVMQIEGEHQLTIVFFVLTVAVAYVITGAAGEAGSGSYSAQGPTPPTRSTAIRIRTPGGGSSIGGNCTSGPR